jgi:hypothetical protein
MIDPHVESRLVQLEADSRALVQSNVAVVGIGGNNGRLGVLEGQHRDLVREVREIRAGRARVTAFFAGLALAVAGAIYWAGATTAEVRDRFDRLEDGLRQHQLRLDNLTNRKDHAP